MKQILQMKLWNKKDLKEIYTLNCKFANLTVEND
jgi:hypothetical protein